MLSFKEFLVEVRKKSPILGTIRDDIIISDRIKKDMNKMAESDLKKIVKVINKLDDPSADITRSKMKTSKFGNEWSARSNNFRILYMINNNIITINSVGKREAAYRGRGD